jgi:hypothetical protein
MAPQSPPLRKELVRPAPRRQKGRTPKRRPVAGPVKALGGPRPLSQALDYAVPPARRRAIAQQRGDDAQAQKLPFEP